MDDFELDLGTKPLVAEVGRALRRARRRQRLSQREFAQRLGVSKSRLARLESDAGPQSLEMVSQVLTASGFRLEVVDVSRAGSPEDEALTSARLELCDAGGRRFPLTLTCTSCHTHRYWFFRNGGWNTSRAFPLWTFERRFMPRVSTRRQNRHQDGTADLPDGPTRPSS